VGRAGPAPYGRAVAHVLSVNVGKLRPTDAKRIGVTGIDKRPVTGPVAVRAPGRRGVGGSGLAGDRIADLRHHGGDDQAVYAYAAEDLDEWARLLGRPLPPGTFGENLTTAGLDVTQAVLGERWRVGAGLVLQVTDPRIPCGTFARWLGERRWERRFTEHAAPGTYLRVLEPGEVASGDGVDVVDRPGHGVTAGLAFRAVTLQPELLPRLLDAADDLTDDLREMVWRRVRGAAPA
jgi:MOSC domain-containing protein YiiM